MRQLVHKVSHTLYCTCICAIVLYIELVLNLWKFKLFYQRIAWKFLFLLVVFLKMIRHSEHNTPLTQITKIFLKKKKKFEVKRLSENYIFPAYAIEKCFDFLNIALLWLKFWQPIKKVNTNKSWRLSKTSFWTKSNMSNGSYTTLLNLELFHA